MWEAPSQLACPCMALRASCATKRDRASYCLSVGRNDSTPASAVLSTVLMNTVLRHLLGMSVWYQKAPSW